MRMKNRWICGLALATALTLGACAPTQQGAEESAPAAETSAPAEASAEAMESSEASESAEPTPVDYEY